MVYIYIYIYIYICLQIYICFHIYICYKCLNEKGNVIFFTLIMLKKYEIIMVSIVL